MDAVRTFTHEQSPYLHTQTVVHISYLCKILSSVIKAAVKVTFSPRPITMWAEYREMASKGPQRGDCPRPNRPWLGGIGQFWKQPYPDLALGLTREEVTRT